MNRLTTSVAVLVLAAAAHGAASTHLRTAAPSTLELEGSSNVTGWRCRGTSIDGEMVAAASAEKINEVIDHIEDGNIAAWMADPSAGRFDPPAFQMTIAVAALRCGSRVMERDMRRALKADAHPTIDFRFTDLRGPIHHDIDANVFRTRVAGELSIAGQHREIVVDVIAQRVARDRFRIRAELPVRMTHFGITPPTALFGLVKARDELVVTFDLYLEVVS